MVHVRRLALKGTLRTDAARQLARVLPAAHHCVALLVLDAPFALDALHALLAALCDMPALRSLEALSPRKSPARPPARPPKRAKTCA